MKLLDYYLHKCYIIIPSPRIAEVITKQKASQAGD
jgi:hypothetical protein